MPKKLMIVIGNGFTLDLIGHFGSKDQIDVNNLFRFGACVPWPADGEPGFLSYKRCPYLWNLGARPSMTESDSIGLIESIITCVNVFASTPVALQNQRNRTREGRPSDVYLSAYRELALYLKHLFVYYDRKLLLSDDKLTDWGWCRFFRRIWESDRYEKITVVSYNYDVWFERVLLRLEIPFSVGEIERTEAPSKITLLKPHGSISFSHNVELDRQAFSISYGRDLLDGDVQDFSVRYDQLDANYLVNALIPPAGESSRLNHNWASRMRNSARSSAQELGPDDDLLICGLSYWHVDRSELDELLTHCDPLINVKMINPKSSRAMDAVLTSLFDNYIAYTSSENLEGAFQ